MAGVGGSAGHTLTVPLPAGVDAVAAGRLFLPVGPTSVRPFPQGAVLTFRTQEEAAAARAKIQGLRVNGTALSAEPPPAWPAWYPPADQCIVHNVMNSIIAVPELYTRVLELMKGMGVPPPFGPPTPRPPLPPPPPGRPAPPPYAAPVAPPRAPPGSPPKPKPPPGSPPPPPTVAPPRPPPPPPPLASSGSKRGAGDLSSDESELESGDEGGPPRRRRAKRPRPPPPPPSLEDAARLVPPAARPATAGMARPPPVIRANRPVLEIRLAPRAAPSATVAAAGGLGAARGARDPDHPPQPPEERDMVLSEELEAGRMGAGELAQERAMKGYREGDPTPTLFIKNVAKSVRDKDLRRVFSSLFPSDAAARAELVVRVMSEGRMRGQAFVTFPTTELAGQGLTAAHGYILEGKPLVVQYGRGGGK